MLNDIDIDAINDLESDYYADVEIDDNEFYEDTIKYISVDKLRPHPDNPRKDVGEVTELADSIHANGILQNLTVVPSDDNDGTYIVIIGHRRLAAAKLAGYERVPCAVAHMDYKQQLHTMLTENMQRSDLTIYEQAEGFQLMLDMGESVDNIARESGFSASTIRRRVKLLDLDKDELKKADERGATLADYAKLDQIKDITLKNEVLSTIGTANFSNKLATAKGEEELQEYLDGVRATLILFAIKIEERGIVSGNIVPMEFVKCWGKWLRPEAVPPEDSKDRQYYYTDKGGTIYLYAKDDNAADGKESEKEQAEEAEREAEYQRKVEQMAEMNNRHAKLRRDFIRSITPSNAKKHIAYIISAWVVVNGLDRYHNVSKSILQNLLGIDDAEGWVQDNLVKSPELVFALMVMVTLDNNYGSYARDNADTLEVWHCGNEQLTNLYNLLTVLGYQMSDEEIAMQNGTHEIFDKE